MSIEQELSDELKDALRAGDTKRKNAIRAIQTEAARAKSEPGFGGDTDDAFFEKIISSFVKKMDKSRREYEELGERGEEMAAKLGFEVEYLVYTSDVNPERAEEQARRGEYEAIRASKGGYSLHLEFGAGSASLALSGFPALPIDW